MKEELKAVRRRVRKAALQALRIFRALLCATIHPRHMYIDEDGTFAVCRGCRAGWLLDADGWTRLYDVDKCRRVVHATRYYAPGIVIDGRGEP